MEVSRTIAKSSHMSQLYKFWVLCSIASKSVCYGNSCIAIFMIVLLTKDNLLNQSWHTSVTEYIKKVGVPMDIIIVSHKEELNCQVVVMHGFNPSPQEAEAGCTL